MEKIAILVDVQNIYYTTKATFNKGFDYNAFWALATENKQIVMANAYAIVTQDQKQRQFHHILRGIGFEVKLKPFITRRDGSAKADWDVGITLDAYEVASSVDKVILLSGDGDFELLVSRIQQRFKVSVDVYSVDALTSQGLKSTCDRYVAINQALLMG